MAKILLVEDDRNTAAMVNDWLEHERFSVEIVYCGMEALDLLKVYDYDVVLLDWQLPDLSGLDVLKQYRHRGGQSKVLMLTGKAQISEKETGLDAGADDYLTKPFDMRELSARIRALLRRAPGVKETVLQCGNVTLDPASARVTRGNEEIKLLPTEFALLEFLMRNKGKVFNAEALLRNVWKSDSEATDNAVRTYITRVRQKIDTPGVPSLIANVHGVGYKCEEPAS